MESWKIGGVTMLSGLLIANRSSLGKRKTVKGAGMGDQEVTDDRRATIGTERYAGLGADRAVEKAGKFGGQGHSSLGVNDSVMGTD